MSRGVVAGGHPATAEAGAWALREGGNAVDAAIAAVLASVVTESPLTGLGAGGFMLVHTPGGDATLLDFFVSAGGLDGSTRGTELEPVEIDFGDTTQIFNVGPASCGVPGVPSGLADGGGAIRLDAARRPRRPGGRARPRRIGDHPAACLPVRDPGADPGPRAGRGDGLCARPEGCSAAASGSSSPSSRRRSSGSGRKDRIRSIAVTSQPRSPRPSRDGAGRSPSPTSRPTRRSPATPSAPATRTARSSRTRPRPPAES